MTAKYPLAHYLPTVVKLYESGWTMKRIGERYGYTRQRVHQVLSSVGAARKKRESACSVEGCTSTSQLRFVRALNRTLCAGHACRHHKGQVVDTPLNSHPRDPSPCTVCGLLVGPGTGHPRARGMCRTHYSNWTYHNVPGRREDSMRRTYAWHKRKYHSDPAYRARVNAYHAEWVRRRNAHYRQLLEEQTRNEVHA